MRNTKFVKRICIVLLCAAALFALTACGNNSERDSESVIVTMPKTAEPEAGFDPAYGWGAGEHTHEPLIQSTLVTTTKEMGIENDLATEYNVSDDGLLWTVKIRDDVKFTNGEKLTAKDVAFTYNNCKENSTVNDFTMLDKAVATDDETVEFRLSRPYSPWPYTMAVVGIVPEKDYSKDYGQNPIGSGRYIMKKWDKGQQVVLEANPDYYGEPAKMKNVTILFMEEDAALAAAKAGEVDVAHTAPTYATDTEIDGYSIFSAKTVDNRGINLPAMEPAVKGKITYGNPLTADVNVRRAINIGIDREKLIDEVLGGYGSAAYSVCDGMPWASDASKVDFDLTKAKALLDEAGWKAGKDGVREKDGNKAELTILYSAGDSLRQSISENLVAQFKKLGIKAKTEGVDWDTAYDRAQSNPLVWGWGAQNPMELYNIYHSQSSSPLGLCDFSPYKNETVDSYMDKALQASDTEEGNSLWQKAQWDGNSGITQNGDIPWVWICNVDHLYFAKDGLNIAEQKIHPHGHGWSIVNNVDEWSWNND